MRGKWQTVSDQSSAVEEKRGFFRRNRMLIIFLLIIITVPAIIYLTHKWDSNRIITGIDLKQSGFVPAKDMMELVPDSLFKKEKGTIKLREIEKALYRNPFVRKVTLSYGLHDRITADIGFRTPIAALIDKQGNLRLADSEAVVLPYMFFEKFPDLYVIRNAFIGDSLDHSVLDSAVKILMILRNTDYRILPQVLNEIRFDRYANAFELFVLSDNLKVMIGDMKGINEKMKNLDIFLENYFSGRINQKLAYIDARWTKQVVVKEKIN